ncbi:coagulation factor X-like [Bradysia coprophila]|uniref:coagulation factor X-like n=1 Tax=Bradysia coprophila TaxID=38358 RepID=UPI00187DAFCE|nr:coagulation factor X-like [Bradysia coprophila]
MMKNIFFGFICAFLVGVVCSQNPITRVVNGSPIEYKNYYAYVEAQGSNVTSGSGTFITRRHVLTSASMIRGYARWVIGYGSVNFTQLTRLTSFVALIHNNVQTQFWPNRNDIGIILLPNDVTSALVEPVTLPITVVPLPRDNEEGLVVGFSNTSQTGEPTENSVLQGVYLQTIAMNRCSSTHIVNPLQNTFCAFDQWFNSNSCSGNVGSGFVVRTRGEELLVGILNTFNPLCRSSDVTTYINIQFFLPWIRAVIGDDL